MSSICADESIIASSLSTPSMILPMPSVKSLAVDSSTAEVLSLATSKAASSIMRVFMVLVAP